MIKRTSALGRPPKKAAGQVAKKVNFLMGKVSPGIVNLPGKG